MWMTLIAFFSSLHRNYASYYYNRTIVRAVPFILTATFRNLLKLTLAAKWNTMFTFSINIVLFSHERPKSNRLTSDTVINLKRKRYKINSY